MKMSNNPTKYEVLIKQYLRSILDISDSSKCSTVQKLKTRHGPNLIWTELPVNKILHHRIKRLCAAQFFAICTMYHQYIKALCDLLFCVFVSGTRKIWVTVLQRHVYVVASYFYCGFYR